MEENHSDDETSPQAESALAAIQALSEYVAFTEWSQTERVALEEAFTMAGGLGVITHSRLTRPAVGERVKATIVTNPGDMSIVSIIFDPWSSIRGSKICPTCKRKLKS
jgi:hypothetical protein